MSEDLGSNLAGMIDRTIKPYLLILAMVFAASFLAGTFVPSPIRRQMTEMFQAMAGDYRELSGGMLFFNILAQNVTATLFVVIFGVIVGIIPTFAVGSNAFGLGVISARHPRCPGTRRRRLRCCRTGCSRFRPFLSRPPTAYGSV